MAFDGITIANLAKELNDLLAGGRIQKVAQPEKDELILTIKQYDVYKLFLSADASLPLVYLYAAQKALQQRPYRIYYPARFGTQLGHKN